jgi:hypothetical protein
VAASEDEGQELNFDRRAPLAMRLEAAPGNPPPAKTPATPAVTCIRPAGATITSAIRPPIVAAAGAGVTPPPLVTTAAGVQGKGGFEAPTEDSFALQVPRRRGWLWVAAILLFGVAAMVFSVLK